MNPDATPGGRPDVMDPGLSRGAAGKAVGGGLQAGTTDFGPATSSMHGGRAGAGSRTSRTTEVGSMGGEASADAGSLGTAGPGPGGGSGLTAAGGNSVLATGRPTRADSRSAIGGELGVGRPLPDQSSADSIRNGAGTTGIGNPGGGLAGSGNSGALDRAADITGDAASAPNYVGAAGAAGTQDANVPADERGAWRAELQDARSEIPDPPDKPL